MPQTTFSTTLGTCGIAWNETAVTGFQLPKASLDDPATSPPDWVHTLIARVQQHLSGAPQDFSDVPLDWSRVSAFQQAVYRQALTIKPGTTRSYGDLARALGLGPEGARAVGIALGNNPWPLLVPCHRVIAANGRMTGFSAPGGVRTKTRLLVLEGAELLSD